MPRPLIATYRLQLGGGFGFAQAAQRLPYLKKLGISHLYLSPALPADEVGLTKLFVIRQALALRTQRPDLFDEHAAYLPLKVTGERADAVVAFARVSKNAGCAAVIVTRWLGPEWGNTAVLLPEGEFHSHLDEQRGLRRSVDLATLFERLPIALLSSPGR